MNEGYKRAALSVHALTEADRQWLLSRLPATEGETLQALVGELNGLGSQKIAGWRRLLTSGPWGAKPSASPNTPTGEGIIGAASVQDVRDILEQEPDWIIAVVLAHRAWPWTAAYLEGIEQHRRVSIGRCINGVEALTPAVREAVVELLEAALRKRAKDSAKAASGAHFEEILRHVEQNPQAKKRHWRSLWSR